MLRFLLVSFIPASLASSCGEKSYSWPFYKPLPAVYTSECVKKPKCDPHAKYRTIDGSCTNLKHPAWSQAGTTYMRFHKAKYQDGKDEPRKSVNGGPLPHVRELSYNFFPDRFIPDECNTFNVMQWGQVIAHDVTHLLNQQSDKPEQAATAPACCTSENEVPSNIPKECLPMEVLPNDPFYSQFDVRCLNYIRAQGADNGTCYKYPKEQVNGISHVIDGSLLYGSDEKIASSLRTFDCGKLKVQQNTDGKDFLPNADNPPIPCFNLPSEKICYTTGDDRVNQNTGITVYTIALMRLHNYICHVLSKLNPKWGDERLYQECRKIVGAFVQHVTFKHYLPLILGNDYVKKKGLKIENCDECCINFHNPEMNPSTYNEFSGSCFRAYHSLVPPKVVFVDKNYKANGSIYMADYFFRPTIIQNPGMIDQCMRGIVNQPQLAMDEYVTKGLTNLLFKNKKKWGNDLESTDTQRGRDLGLSTYNDMRHVCGLKKAKDFDDFLDVMSKESVAKLKSFYSSVDDVDLFIGGLMEELVPGTLVGPTNQCITGEQFYHYMRGDRFYYENCGEPWSFTKAQLKEIYKTSVAWLFCQTGDNIQSMQYNTFHKPSETNPVVSCHEIPQPDFSAWKE